MEIVGIGRSDRDERCVDTIDVWFSRRRQAWMVERLDAEGNQVGSAYHCETEEDAAACLAEWLRVHEDTHLVAPRTTTAAERRVLLGRPQRAA